MDNSDALERCESRGACAEELFDADAGAGAGSEQELEVIGSVVRLRSLTGG
jgi:hypothetical protein